MIVLRDRIKAGELAGNQISEETIMHTIAGHERGGVIIFKQEKCAGGAVWSGRWPVCRCSCFQPGLHGGFFRVEVRDGRLYGVLIDILNHGSKVMLLALGMALVIATSGVDLSVGAVMAIAGAVAAQLINIAGVAFPVVIAAALGVAILAGA